MASTGVIQVGGLATGLDTNSIIDQLVSIEQGPVKLLQQQASDTQATRTALGQVTTLVLGLRDAATALDQPSKVLVRRASSSNANVLSAAAGTGAQRGNTSVTVSQLARGSIAGSTIGVADATTTVAASDGRFAFQVGGGAVQTVAVDGTTTLQQLADKINNLGAGVVATAINLGTAASPDYRLQLATSTTGASSTITVVRDDTDLGVQTTQAGQNATFTVAGFSGTFQRETNTVGDVLTGVTFQFLDTGTSTVTVGDDTATITAKVQALATAFNNLAGYVNDQSTITQQNSGSTNTATDNSVTVGPLGNDTAVRRTLDILHTALSAPYPGATGRYVNLSSIGFATQRDGTVTFDQAKFQAALADDPDGVAALLSGDGVTTGIANSVRQLADQATLTGGALVSDDQSLATRIDDLNKQIASGQDKVDAVKAQLQAQFASLETLVSSLKQQASFLTSAFGTKSN